MARRSAKRAPRSVAKLSKVAKRRRRVRFPRLAKHRRKLIAVALVASLGGGGWFLAHSRLFALNGLEVRGNALLDRQAVVSASGLRVGMNMLSVDAGAVEHALEELAVVKEAKVERLYPSRVRITVVERTPAILVESATGSWLAGSDGGLIVPADVAPPGVARLRIDAPIGSPELTEALHLWASITGATRTRITAIEAVEPGALALIMDGIRVVFGTPDEVDAKLRAAAAVMAKASHDGVRVRQIDVRVPRRPAARLG
jgi:cell division protein FtsQ